MIHLIRHIEFLLTMHECVVIPGLGAVLGVHEPAALDMISGQMMPPRRRFAFNSELMESDGLLVDSVAKSCNVESSEARMMVETAVGELKSELFSVGEVTLGRIGRLESADGQSIRFVPLERDLLTPLVDWLPAIKPVQDQSYEHQAGDTGSPVKRHNMGRRRSIRRFIRNTIGAAAAVFIGLAVSTPVTVDNTHQASLEIPSIKKVEVQVPESRQEQTDESININVSEPASVISADEKVVANNSAMHEQDVQIIEEREIASSENTEASPRFSDDDQYILVVGSLASMKDAEEYVSHLSHKYKDLNFGISGKGNRIRIYAATGNSKEDARKMMKFPSIAKNFKDAWVTSRN